MPQLDSFGSLEQLPTIMSNITRVTFIMDLLDRILAVRNNLGCVADLTSRINLFSLVHIVIKMVTRFLSVLNCMAILHGVRHAYSNVLPLLVLDIVVVAVVVQPAPMMLLLQQPLRPAMALPRHPLLSLLQTNGKYWQV